MATIPEMRPAQYAVHAKRSRQAIGKAIAVGRIPADAIRVDDAGVSWIDVAKADLALGQPGMRVNTPADSAAAADEESASAPLAPAATAPGAKEPPALTRARTEQAEIDARIKQLEYDRRIGKLLDASDVGRAMERCAEAIVRDVDQLSVHADNIVTACSRGGAPAVRALLKEISRGMRDTIAANMRLLAADDDELAGADNDGGDLAAPAAEPDQVPA